MNDRTNSQPSSSENEIDERQGTSPDDPQPESGFTDRQERMEIRQSSPTNPRVQDKSEANQEEA